MSEPTLDIITGKVADWVGFMVTGPTLYATFDNSIVAIFERVATAQGPAIRVDVGYIKSKTDMPEFKEFILTNSYTKALAGKKFTGVTGDIISFGAYGAQLGEESIRFVRKPM